MKRILVICLLATISCQEKSNNSNRETEENSNPPEIFNTNGLGEFYLDDPFEDYPFLIIDGEKLVENFLISCSNCPAGLELSKNGLLSWNPKAYQGSVNSVYNLELTISDPSGSSRDQKAAVSIDKVSPKVGDVWLRSKNFDNTEIMNNIRSGLGRQSSRTGTVIYLGEFAGEHLILTAGHVFDNTSVPGLKENIVCNNNRYFDFPAANLRLLCKELIARGKALDYSIMSVETPKGNISELIDSKIQLRLESSVPTRTPIAVAGYGNYRNWNSELTFGSDDDCLLFSHEPFITNNPRRKKWNDETESYDVYTIAEPYYLLTCDVSSGDSGGPVFVKDTGEVIGIVVGRNFAGTTSSSEIQLLAGDDSDLEKLAYMPLNLFVTTDEILRDFESFDNLTQKQTEILEALKAMVE